MRTKQGDVALLNDPVAQQLLESTGPARFAYSWFETRFPNAVERVMERTQAGA